MFNYNKSPLWIRLVVLLAGCGAIFFYAYHINAGTIIQKRKSLEKKIATISKATSLIREAKEDKDTLIFESHLLDPKEMKQFLDHTMKETPGVSLVQVSFPKHKNLVEYLHEKEEVKKQRHRRRSKKKSSSSSLPRDVKARMATIKKITDFLKLKTEDLVAQKIHIDFYGSYSGVLKYLETITELKDVMWNKIEYTVENYPTAHVKLKLYAITKKDRKDA